MDKKAKTILMVIASIVIIVALFIPYGENKNQKQEAQVLKEFSCSDVSENQENDTKLNKISCQQYQDITKSKDNNLILIARPTCSYCLKFIPILEEIIEEYGINVNYFNTDALSEAEVSNFYNSAELFKSREFGTPSMIITNNGKIVKYSIGYKEKDEAVKWLKDSKIIDSE